MDIYNATVGIVAELPALCDWEEAQTLFARVASRKPAGWDLPLLTCEAVGGAAADSLPGVAAIACLQTSIILIDDMLDDDPRGEYRRSGAATVANLAAALQAAGGEAIAQSLGSEPAKLAALRALNLAALTTAFGQHLDTQNPADEASYWRLVKMKSSPFYRAAMEVGAILGGAAADLAGQIGEFGGLYGEMIQIHDDLNDTMAVPANPDWILGRLPLPILFAQTVNHPEQARFAELRQAATDPQALAEAQKILIRCGAVSYGIHQLRCRYEQGQALLGAVRLPKGELLERLLEGQIEPVRRLFGAARGTMATRDEAFRTEG